MTDRERLDSTRPGVHSLNLATQIMQSSAGAWGDRHSPPTKDPRVLVVRRTGLALSILTALTCVGYILIFFQTQARQVLGPASLLAAASLLFLVGRTIANHGHHERTAYVMVAMPLMLPSFAIFLTGATDILAFGTMVLSIALASLLLRKRQKVWAVLGSIVGGGLTFLIDWVAPWPRFDIVQFDLFIGFVCATIATAILIIVWQIVRAYQSIDTIRVRLLIAFVLVALLPVISISVGAGIAGLRSERRQAFDRLNMVATLRAADITDWVRHSRTALAGVLSTTDIIQHLKLLSPKSVDSHPRELAHQKLRAHFLSSSTQDGQFEEIFLMDSQGRVVVSTTPALEGEVFTDQAFFREGLKGVYLQPPLYFPTDAGMSILFTRPVIDGEGHMFVIAGRSQVTVLNDMVSERAGLGKTVEIYLVDRDRTLLTRLRYGEKDNYVRTLGADEAIRSKGEGAASYQNHLGEPVLGVYRWLPELQLALLVEQDRSEAFHATYVTLIIVGGVALAAVLIAVAVSLLITRSIANPLVNLTKIATRFAAGDLELTAEIEREDEVGALGRAFNTMTGQLRTLIGNLEQRVAERTRDLERRAMQLQAVAVVGQAASSIRDLDELLPRVTHLISARFGYYHAGIFLLDETGEYAVLKAANSEGGQRMLARSHRLRVGEQGIVGYVTGKGEPRVALDVGVDAVYFDNPDMPATRSEMALPLKVGGRVLGALDVQSTEGLAFSEEDVAVLQVLADQVAVAIDNALLFTETQRALEAERRAYGEVSRKAWEEVLRTRPNLGFRSDERGVTRATNVWRPEMEQAWHEGETVQFSNLPTSHSSTNGGQPLAVPIKVRGQVVGILDTFKPTDSGGWTSEEIAALEQIVEQLGATLESARLFEDTQRHAARERLVREITGKIRGSTNLETILQTAVSEVSKALGTSHGAIRLGGVETLQVDGPFPKIGLASLTTELASSREGTEPMDTATHGYGTDAEDSQSQQEQTSQGRAAERGGRE